jgi:AbrB family looped-hinge helix DNA binding protein
MASIYAKVSKSGRLSIPARLRKAVGLEDGGDVVVELDDSELRIRTVDEVVRRAQAMTRRSVADKPGTSVDDFERRREGERE